MASAKQISANRINATKSTGPTSERGKETVSVNAIKHGLTAKDQHLLPGEDPEDYESLHVWLTHELKPIGSLESILVDRIVDLSWRLDRMRVAEAGVLTYAFHNRPCLQAAKRVEDLREKASVIRFEPPEEIRLAEQLLVAAVDKRDKKVPWLGRALMEDSEGLNALAKLGRYETALWNQFTRALRELSALQEKRVDVEKPLIEDSSS